MLAIFSYKLLVYVTGFKFRTWLRRGWSTTALSAIPPGIAERAVVFCNIRITNTVYIVVFVSLTRTQEERKQSKKQ